MTHQWDTHLFFTRAIILDSICMQIKRTGSSLTIVIRAFTGSERMGEGSPLVRKGALVKEEGTEEAMQGDN